MNASGFMGSIFGGGWNILPKRSQLGGNGSDQSGNGQNDMNNGGNGQSEKK
jgi:hypothetical protein